MTGYHIISSIRGIPRKISCYSILKKATMWKEDVIHYVEKYIKIESDPDLSSSSRSELFSNLNHLVHKKDTKSTPIPF